MATSTAISVSQTTAVYGTSVTVTATVAHSSGSNTPPAGSVDFLDGTINLGLISTETLSGSNAIFSLVTTPNQLQVILANGGIHTITAVFSPGNGFNGSMGTLVGGLTVTPAPLTIAATTNTKTYHGTTTAPAIPKMTCMKGTHTVTGLAETYGDRNAGSSKGLSVIAYKINDGNSGKNYTVTTVGNTTGVINKAFLTIMATSNTKTYDSTTAAAKPTVSGLFGSDTVMGLTEAYSNANAGTGKTLSIDTVNIGTTPIAILAVGNAAAMAFDSSGNLYVISGNTVRRFAPGATTPNATLTGLFIPRALAFDGSGNLFVTNAGDNSVSEFAPGATTSSATPIGPIDPNILAFDSSGNLYVANQGGDTVSRFSPGATTPSCPHSRDLVLPDSFTFDASGNLYIANQGSNTVSKFAPGATKSSTILRGLNDPLEALAFDGNGNLYVANQGGNTVSQIFPRRHHTKRHTDRAKFSRSFGLRRRQQPLRRQSRHQYGEQVHPRRHHA